MVQRDRIDAQLWLEEGRINALTLHFGSRELEWSFERHRLQESHRLDRIWIACALLFFAGYGLIEALLLGDGLTRAFVLRYMIGTPLLCFVLAYTFPERMRPYPMAVRLGTVVAIQGLNIALFAMTPYPTSDIYFLIGLLTTVFIHGFGWLRFSESVLINSLVCSLYLPLIFWQGMQSPVITAVHALTMLTVTLTTLFTHYRQEIYLRREYRTRRLMESQMGLQHELVESAEAASAAKSRFLAMMSHELRTPLNAIIGFADIMRAELMGPMHNERYRGYVGDILGSGRHLLRVINDILDLSKAEAGKMVLDEDRVVLAEMLNACVSLVSFGSSNGGGTIRVEIQTGLPDLLADELKLRQMVLNLLSNARKFTAPEGKIVVSAGREASGGICIDVSDDGIGIAPEDMETVLQPFGQAERTEVRRYQGTGLGLPLVREYAGLHGAGFAISSTPGLGTRVTLSFPPARILENADSSALEATLPD